MSRYQNYSNAKGGAGRNKTRRMKRKLPPGARGSAVPIEARPPMLVMRGLRNDEIELRERAAVQAFIGGWAEPIHYQTLADMHSVMLLAGSTDESRRWAYDYCKGVMGPVMQKIAQRYQRTKTLSVTTGEKKVMGEFVTRYREFWLRQPMELYEAACVALQEHYDKMGEAA